MGPALDPIGPKGDAVAKALSPEPMPLQSATTGCGGHADAIIPARPRVNDGKAAAVTASAPPPSDAWIADNLPDDFAPDGPRRAGAGAAVPSDSAADVHTSVCPRGDVGGGTGHNTLRRVASHPFGSRPSVPVSNLFFILSLFTSFFGYSYHAENQQA